MRLPLCATLCAIILSGCAAADRAAHAAEAEGQPIAVGAPAAPAPGDVQVRKVVLFSSGVGYFEHAGTVSGNATTQLRFKVGQINDILKSLLLEDLDGGKIGTVEYASLDPLEKTLRSFQVDITANPTLAQLLNQLRGAKVTVSVQTEKISGTVVGVEKRTKVLSDSKQTIDTWVLNLIAGAMLRQIQLEDVQNLVLDDQQLQDELTKALTALTQARDQDKKPVLIHFDGKGDRHVRMGYVVETPVWKTSYRLVMPPKAGDKALADKGKVDQGQLQGWAIVENQTDNDWKDVQLSLVSGRPISFVEDLYQPLYVPRPTVEPELYASLRPQTYGGGMDAAKDRDAGSPLGNVLRSGGGKKRALGAPGAAATVPAAKAQAMQAADKKEAGGVGYDYAGPMNATASVSTAAAAERLGELFQYTVPAVTLPRQRSAMLPIVTDPVQVERVSIFNVAVLPNHPLNGALITNTTSKHLLQGPMTVLDGGGYAGDATIDNLPPGDHRLISYAIDIPVRVDATSQHEDRQIVSGKIVDGLLVISSRLQFTQTYQFDNTSDDDRVVVVEHSFRQGWTLAADGAEANGKGAKPAEPFERTPQLYRYKVAVAAKKSAKHAVTEQYVQSESMSLADLEISAFDFYIATGAIPQKVKDALAKAAKIRHEMADIQRQIDARQQEIGAIANDQNRLRENMKTVNQNQQSAYYQRLLTKLNDQETQVEGKQAELDTQRAALEAKRKELIEYVASLKVE